jgi:superfamily I DNA and/or RNA helicase
MASHLVHALEGRGTVALDLLDRGKILRFGHARLPEVTSERRLFPNQEKAQAIRRELHEARQRHRQIPERDARARAVSQKFINDLALQLRNLTKECIEQARVVLTTAVQTCIETTIRESLFDIALIDEASMMCVPYVAAIGMLTRERLIILGDFQQLPPIATARLLRDSAYPRRTYLSRCCECPSDRYGRSISTIQR